MANDKYNYWWLSKDGHYREIVQAIRWIDANQAYQYQLNLRNIMLYGNKALLGLSARDYMQRLALPTDRLTLNVIQSVIDAAVSRMATNKPKVMNLTDSGNWSQKQRAKKLDQWTQGIFAETNAYPLGRAIFQDACIFGTGMMKVVEDNGRASLERVFIDDIKIDARDARYGKPRQLFEVRDVPRDTLKAAYPEFATEIDTAGNSMSYSNSGNYGLTDLVSVAEAFHLRSSPDSDDGKHVICTDNCDLMVEDWDKDYFPYPTMRWGINPLGFFGWGIAEQLFSIQTEINYLLRKIQTCMTLATSQLWMQKGSGIDKNKMNNEDFAIREYAGKPPIFLAVQAISPEYYSHLDRLYTRAYEMTGINAMTAQAQKPAGLNSGKALDAYQDNQSQRFMEVQQRYEELFVQVANMLADKTEEIAEREGSYKVKAKSKNGFDLLEWKEVKIDREDYISQPYPVSFFLQTPAGKWNQIQEMMSAQFLTQEEAAELLDYPDLSSVTRLRNAPIEYVQRVIEDMVEKGIPRTPEPYSPIELTLKMLPLEILRAEQDGVPEERIELLRNYMSETQHLLELQQSPPASPPAPEGPMGADMGAGVPPGLPGMQPMSGAPLPPALPNALPGAISQ